MDVSVANPEGPGQCPECKRPLLEPRWLIVDGDERPELVVRISDGSIHTVRCEGGHLLRPASGLLLFRRAAVHRLVYGESRGGGDNRLILSALSSMLKDRLGSGWRDAFTANRIEVLRPLMAAFVDPATTLDDVRTRPRGAAQGLAAALAAMTWNDALDIIEGCPALLAEGTDARLAELALYVGDDDAGLVGQLSALVQACRAGGIAAARRGWASRPHHYDLLVPALEALDDLRRTHGDDHDARVTHARRALSFLDRARHLATWATVQEQLGAGLVYAESDDRAAALEAAIDAFGAALGARMQLGDVPAIARIQRYLALVFRGRIIGSREENLACALDLMTLANVGDRDDRYTTWLKLQTEIADELVQEDRGGKRRALVERAYRTILELPESVAPASTRSAARGALRQLESMPVAATAPASPRGSELLARQLDAPDRDRLDEAIRVLGTEGEGSRSELVRARLVRLGHFATMFDLEDLLRLVMREVADAEPGSFAARRAVKRLADVRGYYERLYLSLAAFGLAGAEYEPIEVARAAGLADVDPVTGVSDDALAEGRHEGRLRELIPQAADANAVSLIMLRHTMFLAAVDRGIRACSASRFRGDTDAALLACIRRLCAATIRDEWRELAVHAELLELPRLAALLDELLASPATARWNDASVAMCMARAFVQRCQVIGVAQALGEVLDTPADQLELASPSAEASAGLVADLAIEDLMSAKSWSLYLDVVRRAPVLLDEGIDPILTRLIEVQGAATRVGQRLRKARLLLRQFREHGIPADEDALYAMVNAQVAAVVDALNANPPADEREQLLKRGIELTVMDTQDDLGDQFERGLALMGLERIAGGDTTPGRRIQTTSLLVGIIGRSLDRGQRDAAELASIALADCCGDIGDAREAKRMILLLAEFAEHVAAADHPTVVALIRVGIAQASLCLGGDLAAGGIRAVAESKQALALLDRQPNELAHVMALNALGLGYMHMSAGDRTTNDRLAIEAFEKLRALPAERGPLVHLTSLHNLGIIYLFSPVERNLDRAVTLFEQASTMLQQAPDLAGLMTCSKLARAHRSLALALFARSQGDDRERAIALLRGVLDDADGLPADQVAEARHDLAGLLLRQDANAGPEASALLQAALATRSRERAPQLWAQSISLLAEAYERASEADPQQLEPATRHYTMALQHYGPELYPDHCVEYASRLANLHARAAQWSQAYESSRLALRASRVRYLATLFLADKELQIRNETDLASSAAYAAARAGYPRQAVAILEDARARMLQEHLATGTRAMEHLRDVAPEVHAATHEVFARLERKRRDDVTRRAEGAASQESLVELEELQRAVQDAIARVRDVPGMAAYLDEVSWDGVRSAFAAWNDGRQPGACAYVLVTQWGALVLSLWPDEELRTTWIDGLDVLALGQSAAAVARAMSMTLSGAAQLAMAIELLLTGVGAALVGPFVEALPPLPERLLLIPMGWLSAVPLHGAAFLRDGAATYLIDLADVSYAPSLRALELLRRDRTTAPVPRHVVVGDTSPCVPPLPYAHAETCAILERLGDGPHVALLGDRATVGELRAVAGVSTHWHFACHAQADRANYLNSEIKLSNREGLKMHEVLAFASLHHVELVTLSACETGLNPSDALDECLALGGAFLHAGARAVVSSLWSVLDLSTSLLMDRFYQEYLTDGADAAAALRRAQRWLRSLTVLDLYAQRARLDQLARDNTRASRDMSNADDAEPGPLAERPFASPYHWAGFYVYGRP